MGLGETRSRGWGRRTGLVGLAGLAVCLALVVLMLSRSRRDEAGRDGQDGVFDWVGSVEMHLRSGEAGLARRCLEEGLEAQPENEDLKQRLARLDEAEGLLSRARACELTSNWPEAELHYQKIIEVEPLLLEGYLGLSWVCAKQEKYRRAIEVLEDRLAADGQCAQAHSELAWIRLTAADESVRDVSEALRHAREAVKLAPQKAEYAQTLARALFTAGRYDEAQEVLEAASRHLDEEGSAKRD